MPLLFSLPEQMNADEPMTRAVAYLKSKNMTPWTTMVLVAAGESNIAIDHLKIVDTSSALSIEAPLMAIAATGNDPRTFAQENLVTKLKSFHTQGQIGDPGLINDDIFGILALRAAGEPSNDAAIQDAKTKILAAQNADGSWGDTNMTAVAIQALIEAGMNASDEKITQALSWLKGAQNDDGGFPYSWPINPFTGQPDSSDSSSSSWGAHAIKKSGQEPSSTIWEKNGKDVIDHLLTLQQPNGSFAHSSTFTDETSFTPVSTAYVVIALLGKSLPVAKFTPSGNNNGNSGGDGNSAGNESISFRIEGSLATACTGTLPLSQVSHALEVVPKAAAQCGFTYEIVQSSFGPYLKTIGADTAQGLIGWMYRVNWNMPEVGAADFTLHEGDTVLWYYGDFMWPPLRISIPQATIESGQPINVSVEKYNNGAWSPTTASVYGGAIPVQTDELGHVVLTPHDGIWSFWAESSNYVRSNRVNVTVGHGNGQSVGLMVNVVSAGGGGGNQGGTVAFVVEPSTLAFGTIAAGSSGSRTLTLKNTGTVGAAFTSTVHGDVLYVDHLKLDNASWRSFNATLAASVSRNINASLSVPSNSAAGVKQGTLVFWATVQ